MEHHIIFIKLALSITAAALTMYVFFNWIDKCNAGKDNNNGIDRVIRFAAVVLSFLAFYFWGILNQIIINDKLPAFFSGTCAGLVSSFIFLLIQWTAGRKNKISRHSEFYITHAVIVFPLGGALAAVTKSALISNAFFKSEFFVLFILLSIMMVHFIVSEILHYIKSKKESIQDENEELTLDRILQQSNTADNEVQITEEKGKVLLSVIENSFNKIESHRNEIMISETGDDFTKDYQFFNKIAEISSLDSEKTPKSDILF